MKIQCLLLSFLFFSCVNSHKLIEEGDPERALELSLKRLARGKIKMRDLDALEIAFLELEQKDKQAVRRLKASGESSIWPTIYEKALLMSKRQKKVKRVFKRLEREGISSRIDLYPVDALLKEAREKSAIYFYAKSQQYLDLARNGDRQAARKAFYALQRCQDYIPGFKDSAYLSAEMRELGISNVLLKTNPDPYDLAFHGALFNEILRGYRFPKRIEWQEWHLEAPLGQEMHYEMALAFGNFYVSADELSSSSCSNSQEIKVGENRREEWSEKDSCYVTIVEELFETVSVTVTFFEQSKRASLDLFVECSDLENNTFLFDRILQGSSSWSNDYSSYIGDDRALGGTCDVGFGSSSFYPSGEELLGEAACSVRGGIRKIFQTPLD